METARVLLSDVTAKLQPDLTSGDLLELLKESKIVAFFDQGMGRSDAKRHKIEPSYWWQFTPAKLEEFLSDRSYRPHFPVTFVNGYEHQCIDQLTMLIPNDISEPFASDVFLDLPPGVIRTLLARVPIKESQFRDILTNCEAPVDEDDFGPGPEDHARRWKKLRHSLTRWSLLLSAEVTPFIPYVERKDFATLARGFGRSADFGAGEQPKKAGTKPRRFSSIADAAAFIREVFREDLAKGRSPSHTEVFQAAKTWGYVGGRDDKLRPALEQVCGALTSGPRERRSGPLEPMT